MNSTNDYMLATSCLATVKLRGRICRAMDGSNAPGCPSQCWLQMFLSSFLHSQLANQRDVRIAQNHRLPNRHAS